MAAPASRLVRKEKSRLLKQTMIFVGLAIGLILVFIFVILPLFIVVLNKVIDTDPFPDQKQVELQAPLLNTPLTATNSAQLELSGFAQPGAEVVLLLNARESSSSTAGDDGAFAVALNLEDGENTLAVFSRTDEETTSANSQEFLVVLDRETPNIVIDEPQPDQRFDRKTQTITVRGLTEGGSKIYINDRLVTSSLDGAFSASVSLKDGANELTIVVVDKAGNRAEQKLTVHRDV